MNKIQKKINCLRAELRRFWGKDFSYSSTLENVDVELEIDELSGIDELIDELELVKSLCETVL